MNIYKFHVSPLLEYGSPLWNVGYHGDIRLLERVQRRWTKAVTGLSDMPYNLRLQRLNLFSFQGRLLRTDLIMVWKIFHDKCALHPDHLFTVDNFSRTRGHQFKLFVPRVNLEVRKRFFSVRVVSIWNSLSEDTVSSDCITSFKRLLHRDLGQLLYDFID